MPAIKKVAKSPVVQIGSSGARGGGQGRGDDYLQGPIGNAVVGLWHGERFPPVLREAPAGDRPANQVRPESGPAGPTAWEGRSLLPSQTESFGPMSLEEDTKPETRCQGDRWWMMAGARDDPSKAIGGEGGWGRNGDRREERPSRLGPVLTCFLSTL